MTYRMRLFCLCLFILTFPSLALAAKTHRVKKNETINSLAKKYHVTVGDLKAANNLVGNHLKVRDVIVIPPRTVAVSGDAAGHKSDTYRVRKSETLASIAKKTGVSISELKRLNGLKKSRVKAGKVLVLKESEEQNQEPKQQVAKKLQLRYSELFNEKDYEQSIMELAEIDPGAAVDLQKSTEMKIDNLKELKKSAYGFLGTRYRFGGTSKNGIDCSSFVQKVFRELEVSLPRTAREQFEVGSEVAIGDLQKGDLIFFHTYASYPSHVGIYLGNNKMIHASSRDRRVVISPMNTSYYRSHFIGAKRISKVNPEVFKLDDLILGVEEELADDTTNNDSLGLSLTN